eukprot:CAMPEP_0198312332 /NCGR_PEP_ID=MMETSP1450-20131203/3732_1 /TAXON_ID=753684 ORGANISM="Madagascaria erythrocladiodes, Strain CCMP3234" /NCGR_SAMPLE_ID=MMETSP1450 /ASSEMBLY_ACC=CAM_ASM_001115 /LENGTH=266 /DNA_ID=CAMNT_0044015277 /DNA_START=88 /DNA_END=888 /DNA_ORIENTATION=-
MMLYVNVMAAAVVAAAVVARANAVGYAASLHVAFRNGGAEHAPFDVNMGAATNRGVFGAHILHSHKAMISRGCFSARGVQAQFLFDVQQHTCSVPIANSSCHPCGGGAAATADAQLAALAALGARGAADRCDGVHPCIGVFRGLDSADFVGRCGDTRDTAQYVLKGQDAAVSWCFRAVPWRPLAVAAHHADGNVVVAQFRTWQPEAPPASAFRPPAYCSCGDTPVDALDAATKPAYRYAEAAEPLEGTDKALLGAATAAVRTAVNA